MEDSQGLSKAARQTGQAGAAPERRRLEVTGIVQGVGFRPYVYRLATELGLAGFVRNGPQGVELEVEGASGALEVFVARFRAELPAAARLDSVRVTVLPPVGDARFEIRESGAAGLEKYVAVSPDLALCGDCRRELHDPADRRFGYPFINCTNCGPRFTIVRDVPYDRPLTTMGIFALCAACRAEYEDPGNRRFHAQPNACAECGPSLEWRDGDGREVSLGAAAPERNARALAYAIAALREGKIVALKGLGGFHLVCDARSEAAVARLRLRKHREAKPFAIMVRDAGEAAAYAEVSAEERRLLASPEAPIVLLRKAAGESVLAESVAPGNALIGIFLPYTPLHELLVAGFGGPLVMTSGNRTDEPITVTTAGAIESLRGIADAFLTHDREIHIRCDDSVVSCDDSVVICKDSVVICKDSGRVVHLRRSRGYAPRPLRTSESFAVPVLAVGAELKNVFCLARPGNVALLSHHIGDLENLATLESFEAGIGHFQRLFNVVPEVIAHDLHPDYLSTKWALEKSAAGARTVGVQHHHAHLVSVLEENGLEGPVLGLALDGTGYGPDGTIWGGEILLADRRDYLRVARLRPYFLPGGAQAIRHPWRTALALAHEAGAAEAVEGLPGWSDVSGAEQAILRQLLERRLTGYVTSSCGRLFDAVSAAAGITLRASYEGQAAIELERVAGGYPWGGCGAAYGFALEEVEFGEDGRLEIDWRPAFRQLLAEARAGVRLEELSRAFHQGLLEAFEAAIVRLSALYGIKQVALSGGCFLNRALRLGLEARLRAKGLAVAFHREVPTSDAGLALGQAVVANRIVKGIESCVLRYR